MSNSPQHPPYDCEELDVDTSNSNSNTNLTASTIPQVHVEAPTPKSGSSVSLLSPSSPLTPSTSLPQPNQSGKVSRRRHTTKY